MSKHIFIYIDIPISLDEENYKFLFSDDFVVLLTHLVRLLILSKYTEQAGDPGGTCFGSHSCFLTAEME